MEIKKNYYYSYYKKILNNKLCIAEKCLSLYDNSSFLIKPIIIMKKLTLYLVISILFIIIFTNCNKEKTSFPDYRVYVAGSYDGISVVTSWSSTWHYDTTYTTMILSIATIDSMVDLTFSTLPSNYKYTFKYSNGTFWSTSNYHPPSLRLSHDTLFYHIQPGLGPYWTDCICKKRLVRYH